MDEKLTVNDLLKTDDVKEIIENLQKTNDIKDLLVIWSDGEDIHWQANSIPYQTINWYIDSIKQALFMDEE
jgi:hypothetical protein